MASSGSALVAGVQVGQMIEHERFGLGEVLKVEGTGDNAKATIHFKMRETNNYYYVSLVLSGRINNNTK